MWNFNQLSGAEMTVLRNIAPCSLAVYRRFGVGCYLHHQGTTQHPRKQSSSYSPSRESQAIAIFTVRKSDQTMTSHIRKPIPLPPLHGLVQNFMSSYPITKMATWNIHFASYRMQQNYGVRGLDIKKCVSTGKYVRPEIRQNENAENYTKA